MYEVLMHNRLYGVAFWKHALALKKNKTKNTRMEVSKVGEEMIE